ncbi:PAS domain S-box protein [Sphingomonas sp. MMS24-J13]|uniref:PAS domain S-box protein n=1 Tax=Sphingomonas sp. MMS24-J13 TaxID=3238686 RepID=UPI00384FF5D1
MSGGETGQEPKVDPCAVPPLPAGSAVGVLIAARDWSATPLGPIEAWPSSLRCAVSLLLEAPVPMILFWGLEHIALYNDAYAGAIGDRHPASLGARARDRWAHIWHQMGPPLTQAFTTGEAMSRRDQSLMAIRGGVPTETFFDISFSAVREADGSIGGVLAIAYETSDRVRATRAATAERERLSQMFEQAPSFMALLREPGHVIELANAGYQQLTDNRAVVGMPIAEALPEIAEQGFIALLDRVAESGAPYRGHSVPVALRHSDGSDGQFLLDFVYQPVFDEDGQVSGIFVEGIDVTERVRTQERLALSENALRLAIEVAEIGTWDYDLVNDTLAWDDQTKAMFGMSPTVNSTIQEFYDGLHPDDRDATTRAFAAALDPAIRATYDVEYRTVGKEDGRVRWVAAKGRGLFDAEGVCVRAIGTALDITARKLAQEALRESEQRFRTIADSAPALIWLCDETGQLVFANQWHEETFGVPARELLGGGWQAILHPDDVESFCSDFDNAFAIRAPFSRDVRVIDRRGVTRWLHSEARPRHAEGRFVGYVGCDVDITEVHRVSEQLERGIAERTGELAATNRQLSTQIEERERVEATLRQMQRLEAIGQLTSGVAHDFNNLLTVVLGNIDMIARVAPDGPLDERSIKRLSYIRAAAERGATLTAQLLAFSRRQRLEARPVDLNDTVAGMRDLMQSSMGGSVRMEIDLQSELWPAMVDPTQIELIILNLAINARDAMAVGGALTVATGNVVLGEPAYPEEPAPGEYVMIAVADSGTGMTPEVRAKAFEPFFTTKEVGKGSGLGLAQVFGFAKQSGGGVAIETELGVGTTVRVYLPRAVERRSMPRPVDQPHDRARAADASGKRILLVDDDQPVREVTANMLRAMGADVIERDSGGAALELVEREDGAFDLMVVDFAMPGMNGAELVAAVGARWPDLPALFVTGYADLTAIANVSADRIVQKPFRRDELQRKAVRLLAKA